MKQSKRHFRAEVFIILPLFLQTLVSNGHAQTAAQKALMAEPEMQSVASASDSFQQQQAIPKGNVNSPSAGQTLVTGFTQLAGQQILMRRLKDRLELQAEQCGFCATKQNELAELLREQVAFQTFSSNIYKMVGMKSGASTSGIANLLGMDTGQPYWDNKAVAIQQMRDFKNERCPRGTPPSTLGAAETALCRSIREDQLAAAAIAHQTAWSTCFQAHDWVATDGQRGAFEKCMLADDAVTKLCRNSGKLHEGMCGQLTTIESTDVPHLRSFHAPGSAADIKDKKLAEVRPFTELQPVKVIRMNIFGVPGIEELDHNGLIVVRQQVEELRAVGQQIMVCEYVNPEKRGMLNSVVTYSFWYASVPANLNTYLTTLQNHPFNAIGRTVLSTCPATAELAQAQTQ